jgi:acylphosphatase
MPPVRKHLFILGRVQGVFFRATLQEFAYRNGITGWVANNYDGSVEAVLEGESDNVDRVVKWCHRGPRGAYVSGVDVEEEDYSGHFSTFAIKY